MPCPFCNRPFSTRSAIGAHIARKHPNAPTIRVCGTVSAYTGGCRCDRCRQAKRETVAAWRANHDGYHVSYMRRWRERRRMLRRRGATWQIICDYLETHGPSTKAQLVARIQDRHPDIPDTTIDRALHRCIHDSLVTVAATVPMGWSAEANVYQLADPDWLDR